MQFAFFSKISEDDSAKFKKIRSLAGSMVKNIIKVSQC